jgi:hypothetical protein
MREVARRLDYDPSFLAQHFSKRCGEISRRYLRHLGVKREERLERIHEEIRQATYQVHDRGEYPSEKRITPLLTKPWYLSEPGARAMWHETLRKIGWEVRFIPR